jgi:hypothetical protein
MIYHIQPRGERTTPCCCRKTRAGIRATKKASGGRKEASMKGFFTSAEVSGLELSLPYGLALYFSFSSIMGRRLLGDDRSSEQSLTCAVIALGKVVRL